MLTSFDYTLSRDEYVRGLQVISLSLADQDRWRSVRCLSQLAIIGLAIAIAVYVYPGSLDGIMLAVILIWWSSCIMQARNLRRWRELAYDPAIAHLVVKLTDDGISERHDRGGGEWSWDGVRRIHELPDAVIVEMSNWHAIALPHRLWADQGGREDFVNTLRQCARNALPDLPKSRLAMATGSGLLTLGAVALAFDLFILTNVAVGLAGFDVCSCAIRRSFGFHAFAGLMVVATLAVFILTKLGLERLKNEYPRLAFGIATAAICLLAAILLAGLGAHYAFI
jgi:hypothetical protein